MIRSIPIIGVMGSGKTEHSQKSEQLGKWIAESGYHLLTGGGQGVMAAVSCAFCSVENRKGLSIGIIPAKKGIPKTGYPNRWVELPIMTHLGKSGKEGLDPASRNHINILTAQVIIALPGGYGTGSEVELAVNYKKPLIAFIDSSEDISGLSSEIPRSSDFQEVKNFAKSILENN